MPKDALFSQIWSSRALVDPSMHVLVVNAHKKYIEAGATMLTTSSYGVQVMNCIGYE
jgi:S-methylmethionine-dependent homocysteine/selenocysteine methylase